MMEIAGKTVIRFVKDVAVRVHYFAKGGDNRFMSHTMKAGRTLRCNLMQCEVEPHRTRVDVELNNGNMIYHVPRDSFEFVAGIRTIV